MRRRRRTWGEGSLIQRANGRWQAQWSQTEGGIRTRSTQTFGLKTDAEWWLSQKRRGIDPDNPLLSEYLTRWLAGKRSLRESTRALYATEIRVHIEPALGGFRLNDLRRRHVDAFVTSLERTLSPRTVALVLRIVSAALSAAVKDGLLSDSPAAAVEPPAQRRNLVVPMTDEEAAQIVAAVTGHWTEYVVRFLLGSGCRVGEACALDQGDIGDGFVLIRTPKTVARSTHVSEDAMAALTEAKRLAPRRGKHEPVFFGPNTGDRLRREAVTHGLVRVLERAGLPRRTAHALRHGVATVMLSHGYSTKVIADQLGNTESVVASTYAHVTPRLAREAIGTMDEAVKAK